MGLDIVFHSQLQKTWFLLNLFAFIKDSENQSYYLIPNVIFAQTLELMGAYDKDVIAPFLVYLASICWISSSSQVIIQILIFISIAISQAQLSFDDCRAFCSSLCNSFVELLLPVNKLEYKMEFKSMFVIARFILMIPMLMIKMQDTYIIAFCSFYLLALGLGVAKQERFSFQVQSAFALPSSSYGSLLFTIIQFTYSFRNGVFSAILSGVYFLSLLLIDSRYVLEEPTVRKDVIFRTNYLYYYLPRIIQTSFLVVGVILVVETNVFHFIQLILLGGSLLFILLEEKIKTEYTRRYPPPIYMTEDLSNDELLHLIQERFSFDEITVKIDPNRKSTVQRTSYNELVDEELEKTTFKTKITLVQLLVKCQAHRKLISIQSANKSLKINSEEFDIFNYIEQDTLSEILCYYLTEYAPKGIDFSRFNQHQRDSMYFSWKLLRGETSVTALSVRPEAVAFTNQALRIKIIHTAFYNKIQPWLKTIPSYVFLDLHLESLPSATDENDAIIHID